MDLETEINRLYQLSLDQFTPARNALAKDLAGAPAQQVKALAKPALAAWTVNQLYWTDRKAFDRLIEAAEGLRSAHRATIEGRKADLRGTQEAHRKALRLALTNAVSILEKAGHPVTSVTRDAITRTLEALPSEAGQPGRLTGPLEAAGFALLAGVTPRAVPAPTIKPDAKRSAPKPTGQTKSDPVVERQLRHARETLEKAHAALNIVTRDLGNARADEVKKTEALAQVRQSRMAFEEALERAQDAVQVAAKNVSELERSSG